MLFTNDESNEEEEYESNDNQEMDATDQDADGDMRAFLSLAGSLKE